MGRPKKIKVEELVEEPVIVSKVEEPPKNLGVLGPHKIKIVKERKVEINGRQYTELELEDHSVVTLNEHDLTAQRVV